MLARAARETSYDGYVVNAVIDAEYASIRSKKWEPIELALWRVQATTEAIAHVRDYDAEHVIMNEERMPDGNSRLILRNKQTGNFGTV